MRLSYWDGIAGSGDDAVCLIKRLSPLSDKPPGHSLPNGWYNIASRREPEMLIPGTGMGQWRLQTSTNVVLTQQTQCNLNGLRFQCRTVSTKNCSFSVNVKTTANPRS